MKLFSVLALVALLTCVLAWTKEDHEIFDLVSALEASEGKGTTFYSFLGVAPQAQLKDINRQYRKRSLDLHPDKNRNVKDIHARFARLGTITEILRDPAKRTRYDVGVMQSSEILMLIASFANQFFFKNGVPKWRGTGYYYSRFRPSIAHVLFFLVLLSSLIHYAILRVNYRRDRERIEYFTRAALAKAGGSGSLTNGSATPTTDAGSLPTDGQDGVLASIIDQVDRTSGQAEAGAPVISKRQAKLQAREAKKDKSKRAVAASPVPSGTSTPVPVAASSRRRKVRVPMVEGSEYSQSLELVVVDGEVFMPDGDDLTSITTLSRPPSWHAVWPVVVYNSLVSRFKTKRQDGSEEGEDIAEGSLEGAIDANGNPATALPRKKSSTGGKLAAMRRRKASMK